jgi:uncharacterized protein YciI
MKYLVLTYAVVEDFIEKRTPFREAHLALARNAHARGELLLAGAVSDPVGALLIFHTDSPDAVDRFVRADPYVAQGLVKSWKIRPWAVVVGGHSQ